MALRVLLGDKSPMIQRIFKWSLQDYGVKVFSLSTDENTLTSVRDLKPDLIFLDVLLKNKNGYDLSYEIKSQKDLSSIPIVLLWSHFVKLDEEKFKSSLANQHLEKPFKVEFLRKVVQDLVPKVNTQPISQFLTFPKTEGMENVDRESFPPMAQVFSSRKKSNAEEAKAQNGKDSQNFEETKGSMEDVTLEPAHSEEENLLLLEEEEDWVQKNVFKEEDSFSLLDDKGEERVFAPGEEEKKKDGSTSSFELEGNKESVLVGEKNSSFDLEQKKGWNKKSNEKERDLNVQISEDVIYQQSQKIIESIAWQIVPELASQVIEKEIKRLLKEKDQDI